jgi:hypothetical protein
MVRFVDGRGLHGEGSRLFDVKYTHKAVVAAANEHIWGLDVIPERTEGRWRCQLCITNINYESDNTYSLLSFMSIPCRGWLGYTMSQM